MLFAPTAAGGVRGDRPGVPRTPGSLESLPKPIQRRFGGIGIAPEQTTREEWLLTTGTGGYAMGTAPGIPTRRYHGLLVASITPPVRRAVLLSEFVADIDVPSRGRFAISTFNFAGGVRHPDGASRLELFENDGLSCRWVWRFNISGDDVTIVRELTLAEGRSAAVVRYAVAEPGTRMRLHLRPLCAMRNFHALQHEQPERNDDQGVRVVSHNDHAVDIASTIDGRRVVLRLQSDNTGKFNHQPDWWRRFVYDRETERGQDNTEDMYSPGEFTLDVVPGDNPVLQISASMLSTDDDGIEEPPRISQDPAQHVTSSAWARRERLGTAIRNIAPPASSGLLPIDIEAIARLVIAADSFVVRKPACAEPWIRPGGTSIIAGYPWFSDWGRDSMIALPGLLLSCGRHAEALEVLRTFAGARQHGLIPNRFDDDGGESEYNTADASMWFLHAACAWLDATNDRQSFQQHLRPACEDLVNAHQHGTIYDIRMDPADALITAGTLETQLTWMDARRDGVVFTPRHGKAVEINALWHHGLCALSRAIAPDDKPAAEKLKQLAERVRASFQQKFWNENDGCLFDRLEPPPSPLHNSSHNDNSTALDWRPSREIRPNQLFAVSLEHSPLSQQQQASVVRVVKERLLTPVGVRTLDPADPAYKPAYTGPLFQRDEAYHQGTAWPWLLGPYAEAVLRADNFSEHARQEALNALRPILHTLDSHGLGTISEVYDGGPTTSPSPQLPTASHHQHPDGCPAQAWSVSEVLRATLLALSPAPSPTPPAPTTKRA